MRPIAAICLTLLCLGAGLHAQTTRKAQKPPAPAPNLLDRHYRVGETLNYIMKGVNEGRRYEAHATAVVKREAEGTFFEEYTWTSLALNGANVALPPQAADFHQEVSLALKTFFSVPSAHRQLLA